MAKTKLTAEQQARVNELKQMSPLQWESICKGCGICCLCKTTLCFTPSLQQTFFMDVCCDHLDKKTKKCTIYNERLDTYKEHCRKVDINIVLDGELLPASCGYVEYVYGPAPSPINVEFDKIGRESDVNLDDLDEVIPHLIMESCNWRHK